MTGGEAVRVDPLVERRTMKLYELSKELVAVNDQIITEAGEVSPELEKRLDELQLAFAEKTHGIRKWVAQIDGDDTVLEREINRLENIKRTRKNLRERLLEYVKANMQAVNLKKIETPIGGFVIQNNPHSVIVDEPEKLPEKYIRVIITEPRQEVDKVKIKKDIEAGVNVPGARLEIKTRISVK